MSELGQYLKEKRTEKDISLEQLQEMTKIRKRYLEAIEEGDYDIMPGSFYARAFVRSYAEAIGVDAEETIEQFKSELPKVPTGPGETLTGTRSRHKEVKKTPSIRLEKWMSNLLLYAFILLIVFVGYVAFVNYNLFSGNEPEADPDQAITGEGEVGAARGEDEPANETVGDGNTDETGGKWDLDDDAGDDEEENEEETPPESEITLVESDGNTTVFEVTTGGERELTLSATSGAVWFRLNDAGSGDEISSFELQQGNEETWDVGEYEEVQFRFGNTLGMELLLNGEQLEVDDYSGPHNVTIRFDMNEEA